LGEQEQKVFLLLTHPDVLALLRVTLRAQEMISFFTDSVAHASFW
jgi:hypothetical protein